MAAHPADAGRRLTLLGGWRLAGAHVATDGFAPAAQRFCAAVALHGPLDRAGLAALLWPGAPLVRAGARLRDLVSRNVCVLEVVGPVRVSEGFAIRPDVSVDVTALRERLRSGVDLVAVAAAPDLLPGWYEDWVCRDRDRLRDERRDALVRHARALLAHDHDESADVLAEALLAAQAAVRLDPLCEDAVRVLVAVHLTAGDLAPAARCLARLRVLLTGEPGVEPSPETLELISGRRTA